MIASELPYYAGIGAVLALLVWSACRLRASRQRFAYRALLVFAALLAATVVLADLKHSTGKVVMTTLIFALSGATVVVSIRLLWAAWQAPHWQSRLRLTSLAALLFLIALVVPPNFVPARVGIPHSACRANLRLIQGAKEMWAMDLKTSPAEVPRLADLVGPDKYLRDSPVCPLGGTYQLRAVREMPTCSMGLSHPGHRYDFDQ